MKDQPCFSVDRVTLSLASLSEECFASTKPTKQLNKNKKERRRRRRRRRMVQTWSRNVRRLFKNIDIHLYSFI